MNPKVKNCRGHSPSNKFNALGLRGIKDQTSKTEYHIKNRRGLRFAASVICCTGVGELRKYLGEP